MNKASEIYLQRAPLIDNVSSIGIGTLNSLKQLAHFQRVELDEGVM